MIAILACLLFEVGLPEAPEQDPQPEVQAQTDDLARKLIRKSVDESATDDPMTAMLEEMDEVGRRLHDEFDPGEQTQSIQRQVSARLDDAIKAAAARRRAKSQPDPKQTSDKRTMPGPRKSEPRPAQAKQGTEAAAKAEQQPAPAGDAKAEKPEGRSDLPNARRTWGNLPQRDRDEVLQGAEEESLERYRQWIDQYFRALQESNK